MIKKSFFSLVSGFLLLSLGCSEAVQGPHSVSSQNAPLLVDSINQLKGSIKPLPEPDYSHSNFGATTEMELGKIEPLLSQAPRGMFVTVGGDRAFRGAALLKKIEALIIFDVDLRTVRFNQINAKLLKANDLNRYRHLRWNAPFKDWQELDKSLTREDYNFWRSQVDPSSPSEM